MLSLEEGTTAVKTARKVVKEYLTHHRVPKVNLPEIFREKRGVFVTINRYRKEGEGDLRGCIGFPEPVMRLEDALLSAAVKAAVEDPRFPPVSASELPRLIFEVSVLTPPKPIPSSPSEVVKHVKVGRDGLIVKKGFRSGLLLPQVPVEYGWDATTFLDHTCTKAGLDPNEWKRGGCAFFAFQAQVFSEISPEGPVKEKELG